MKQLETEAKIFGKYIIGNAIETHIIDRYILASHKLNYLEYNNIIQIITKNPWLLPYFDAGYSLTNKKHLLQKKLLLMFALLETDPKYSDHFLAKPRSILYLFTIIFIGFKAVFKAIIGFFLTKIWK